MRTQFLKAFLLLILFSGLSSCTFQNSQTDVFESDPYIYVKKSGIIKTLSAKDQSKNLEKILEVNENEKYLLTSLFLDLNHPKYLGQKVNIIGALHKQSPQNLPLIEVEQVIFELENTASNETNTGQKELYISEKLGIKLSYDKSLTLKEKKDQLVFYPKINQNESAIKELIEIRYHQNKNNDELSTWLNKIYPSQTEYLEVQSDNLEIIDSQIGNNSSIKAKKVVKQNYNDLSFFTLNKKGILQLSYRSINANNPNTIRKLFYELIYSLEYLEP